MILYIDTSDKDTITVGIDEKRFKTSSKEKKSEKLLPFIDKILKEQKLSFKDISEIKVNTGPGSFTGLRVGVTVAQTIGWVLGVPVNRKDVQKGEKIEIKY